MGQSIRFFLFCFVLFSFYMHKFPVTVKNLSKTLDPQLLFFQKSIYIPVLSVYNGLTNIYIYISMASFLWDIGNQNSPRRDAAKLGVASGVILLSDIIEIKLKYCS